VATAVVLALLLLQAGAPYRTGPGAAAPASGYRTGPVAATPAPGYRTGAQTDTARDEEDGAPAGYAVSPDALRVTPRLRLTGVSVDAYDAVRAEGQRPPEDRAYEATVLGGAAAAQDRQGALDGAWELRSGSGKRLYAFQLSQGGEGEPAEGAWRSVSAAAGRRVSGFVLVAQESGRLTLRFFEPGGSQPIVVTLQPGVGGSWRGAMAREGASSVVELRRR